jgi:hypothetical protein
VRRGRCLSANRPRKVTGAPANSITKKRDKVKMTDAVKVELTEEKIEGMTDSEKLSTLIRIAFANHTRLNEQNLILFGNGDPKKGLCFKVAMQGTRLNWLIGILSVAGVALIGAVITHIVG